MIIMAADDLNIKWWKAMAYTVYHVYMWKIV